MDIFELRQKANASIPDAEACNRLGEQLLISMPPDLSDFWNVSPYSHYVNYPMDDLKRALSGLDYAASDAFAHNVYNPGFEDSIEVVRTVIRVRENGLEQLEQIVRERAALRNRQFKEAFYYFEKSGLLGDPEGLWNCGWRYWLGEGVEKSEVNAILYWSKSAAKGHTGASKKLLELISEKPLQHYIKLVSPETITPEIIIKDNKSNNLQRKLRVFLCHAKEDKKQALTLYQRLTDDGFSVWLDEKSLLPGQNWQPEIEKAVRESDAVVVCISKTSISKKGFVQKEIVVALDVATEQPEGAIYIIPVRLEDCAVPNRLLKFQYVDNFSKNGYDLIVAALRSREIFLGL